MNKFIVYQKLLNMDEAVEIGGFRQWLEEGCGFDIDLFCDIFKKISISDAPKTIKAIEKIMIFLKNNNLSSEDSLKHNDIQCDTCAGRGILDDGLSGCPVCRNEGIIWVGPIANQHNLLNTISEMYLKIPYQQRANDIKSWCKIQ